MCKWKVESQLTKENIKVYRRRKNQLPEMPIATIFDLEELLFKNGDFLLSNQLDKNCVLLSKTVSSLNYE